MNHSTQNLSAGQFYINYPLDLKNALINQYVDCLSSNNGFYSAPTSLGSFFIIGSSKDDTGEYVEYNNVRFYINGICRFFAKENTYKASVFLKFIEHIISKINAYNGVN